MDPGSFPYIRPVWTFLYNILGTINPGPIYCTCPVPVPVQCQYPFNGTFTLHGDRDRYRDRELMGSNILHRTVHIAPGPGIGWDPLSSIVLIPFPVPVPVPVPCSVNEPLVSVLIFLIAQFSNETSNKIQLKRHKLRTIIGMTNHQVYSLSNENIKFTKVLGTIPAE